MTLNKSSKHSFIKKASNKVQKFYENIWVRLGITVAIIIITIIVYKLVKGVSYSNLWLICSFGVTYIITGIIFLTINFSTNESTDLAEERFIMYFISIFLLGIFLFSLFLLYSNTLILNVLAVFISIVILVVDYYLAHTNKFPKLKENYFPFDLSIVAGVTIVVILDWAAGHILGITSRLGGGAAAFQIIMANLVFDPENYKI